MAIETDLFWIILLPSNQALPSRRLSKMNIADALIHNVFKFSMIFQRFLDLLAYKIEYSPLVSHKLGFSID